MDYGVRLRAVRIAKKMSQGDVEQKTGLLRCYLSRVENGHTVPSVETTQKLCAAFGIPLHEFFYEGEGAPKLPDLKALRDLRESEVAPVPKEFMQVLPKLSDRNMAILFAMARAMAKGNRQ